MSITQNLKFIALTTLVFAAINNSAYSQIATYLDDQTGLPVVVQGEQLLLESKYAFWGGSWKWAAIPVEFEILSSTRYRSAGYNQTLDFKLSSETVRSQRKFEITFQLFANSRIADAVGGGLVFKLDKSALKNSKSPPELLPDNTGWKWRGIEVRFSKPLALVSYEKKTISPK